MHSETAELRNLVARAPKQHSNGFTGHTCHYSPILHPSSKGGNYGVLLGDRAVCVSKTEFVLCGSPKLDGSFVWSEPQTCGPSTVCKEFSFSDSTSDSYRVINYNSVMCDYGAKFDLPPSVSGYSQPPKKEHLGSCNFNHTVAGCTADQTGVQLCGSNGEWYPAAACGSGTKCHAYSVNGKGSAYCDFI